MTNNFYINIISQKNDPFLVLRKGPS